MDEVPICGLRFVRIRGNSNGDELAHSIYYHFHLNWHRIAKVYCDLLIPEDFVKLFEKKKLFCRTHANKIFLYLSSLMHLSISTTTGSARLITINDDKSLGSVASQQELR